MGNHRKESTAIATLSGLKISMAEVIANFGFMYRSVRDIVESSLWGWKICSSFPISNIGLVAGI